MAEQKENRKIRIAKIEPNEDKNGRLYRKIEDSNGKKYSVWDEDIQLEKDNEYDCEVITQKSGKFTFKNITSAKLCEGNKPVNMTEVWDLKDRRMVRMNALRHAVAYIVLIPPADITLDAVLHTAEEFENWVYRNGSQKLPQETKEEVEATPKYEEPKSENKVDESLHKKITQTEFANLTNIALQHNIKRNDFRKFLEKYGCMQGSDITVVKLNKMLKELREMKQ